MKCLICETSSKMVEYKTFELTEAEKKELEEPLEAYVYCQPCWRVLSDPVQGPALMKGLAQQRLRLLGVSPAIAEALAESYHKALVVRAASSKS